MATERLLFTESKIPQVVALIRRGLKDETDKDIREKFEYQCEELEASWKRLQSED